MNNEWLNFEEKFLKCSIDTKFLFVNFAKIKEQLIFSDGKLLQYEQQHLVLFPQIL